MKSILWFLGVFIQQTNGQYYWSIFFRCIRHLLLWPQCASLQGKHILWFLWREYIFPICIVLLPSATENNKGSAGCMFEQKVLMPHPLAIVKILTLSYPSYSSSKFSYLISWENKGWKLRQWFLLLSCYSNSDFYHLHLVFNL